MLLKTSLSGGILIIFVIILRFLLIGKLPKRTFTLLWDIVLLRLLVPFDLPFKYGIAVPAINNTNPAIHTTTGNTVLPAGIRYITVPQAVNNTYNTNLPLFIWITGMIALFIIFALLYIKEYLRIREALPVPAEQAYNLRQIADIPLRTSLLISDRISTPINFGILYPKIIFPKFFKLENSLYLKYIITHELIHIKRADNLRKLIILFAICIHWFNPLVWIMYILFNRDLELSCDEKVVSIFGDNAKKDYAMALIYFAENQCKWRFFSNGFGKKPIQERIEAIMKYKKLTIPSTICAAIILGTAVTVFAKGETGKNSTGKTTVQESISKEGGSYETEKAPDNLSGLVSKDDFKEYEKYGLSYNEDTGHIMYNGKIVGYFHDNIDKNSSTHITDEAGEIGIRVERNPDNGITGLKKVEIPEDTPVTESDSNINIPYETQEEEAGAKSYTIVSYNTIDETDSYASSEANDDNSTTLEKYTEYGITYNKSLDTWQYKGKNIAGLIVNAPENLYDNKTDVYIGVTGTVIYVNETTGKNHVYIIIDKDSVKEVTEKEFNKMLEQ